MHQLRIFETVARLGNFSRAARELSITQPAVSVQVQELERAFGTPLLQRLGRKIVPTEAGDLVLRYAREIFALVEALNVGIAELRGLQRGTVRLGASPSFVDYFLPPLVARFREEFPGISVRLTIADPDEVVKHVLNGEVSLGLAAEPRPDPQIVAYPIGQDEFVVIAPPGHRYERRRAIPVQALRSEPWIFREAGSEARLIIERVASQRGLVPTPTFELSSTEAIKRAVIAGLGIAIVPAVSIAYELAAGALCVLDVPELTIKRQLAILHHRMHRLNKAEATLLQLARQSGLSAERTESDTSRRRVGAEEPR
ncbi:MAG: LysR family transcriptional regulator [Chloroflexota bacterium]|nr:LysR family transcriptional regulator [Dehalococcoidia bacterium]MDW8254620.1 LysR family transcriptional regulator [Chloroflexota bacterium]